MKKLSILAAVLALALATMSCNLIRREIMVDNTNTAPNNLPSNSSATGEACLAGNWNLADAESYLTQLIPSELTSGGDLAFDGTSGSLVYSFDGNGMSSLQADTFTANFKMNMSGLNLPVAAILNGSGSAGYTVQGDTITYTSVDTANLLMSVEVAGAEVMSPTPFTAFFETGSQAGGLSYTCAGNSLTLYVPGESTQPITLQRVP